MLVSRCLNAVYPRLKAEWQALRRSRAGHRFQDRYAEARKTSDRQKTVSRILRLMFAIVALAIGVVLLFIPGPAILFFVIAGSLFASESRGVAHFLDGAELRIRAAAKWGRTTWKKLPPVAKIAAILATSIAVAGAAVLSYRLFLG